MTARVQSLTDYSRNVHCDRDFIEIGGQLRALVGVALAERAAATVRAAIHDRVESNRQTADRALGWDKPRRGRHRAGTR